MARVQCHHRTAAVVAYRRGEIDRRDAERRARFNDVTRAYRAAEKVTEFRFLAIQRYITFAQVLPALFGVGVRSLILEWQRPLLCVRLRVQTIDHCLYASVAKDASLAYCVIHAHGGSQAVTRPLCADQMEPQ